MRCYSVRSVSILAKYTFSSLYCAIERGAISRFFNGDE
jgi:hypothetical protein